MIVFNGKISKDGRWWAIAIPSLTIYTQGPTRTKAFFMIQDALKLLVDQPGFKTKIIFKGKNIFQIAVNDEMAVFPLLLRQQRSLSGKTLKQVAHTLGYKSLNGYAQYEQGRCQPTLAKAQKFLSAINSRAALSLNVVEL